MTISESSTLRRMLGHSSPSPMSEYVPGKIWCSTSLTISERTPSRSILRARNSQRVSVLDRPDFLSVPSSMVAFMRCSSARRADSLPAQAFQNFKGGAHTRGERAVDSPDVAVRVRRLAREEERARDGPRQGLLRLDAAHGQVAVGAARERGGQPVVRVRGFELFVDPGAPDAEHALQRIQSAFD